VGELAAKLKGDPIGEWLFKAVDFFRKMGFFEKYKNLSKKDFIKKIFEFMEDSPWMFSPNSDEADLPLLFLDKDRVYNCPMMGDANLDYAVFEKAKRYKEFVQNLNPIGRNIVKFENIKEKWMNKEGPIEVSFKYKGKIHKITQDYFGDFFDYSFINQINKIIQDSGYFFDLYDPYDMVEWGGFITLMNSEEKEKLIKERNWKLYSEDGFKNVRQEIEEVYLERVCEKWANEAFDYEKEGKYEEAFKLYAKVLNYETDIALDPDIWYETGHMLTLLGRYEESKQYLNKAIEIYDELSKDYPDHAKNWFKMTRTYALLKNKDKTLETLKKAIELDSKYKSKAKEDENFKFIREDKDFIDLIK
jgi:tetratricopeptide (TPR) repeat protein